MKVIVAAMIAAVILAQEPSAEDVRARLNDYLTAYEPKLSELIADEEFLQRDVPTRERRPGSEASFKRTLKSEVAFIALPGAAGWLGFRRVLMADARAVDDTLGSLNAVLSTGKQEDYARARAMLNASARFNLGAPRTTNLPNLPLELLHPRHAARFAVHKAGTDRIGGTDTIKLVFVENVSPTIITTFGGDDMRSIISAFVEPGNGRLWRADVITRDPQPGIVEFDYIVSVQFQPHKDLGLLVPSTMHEDFFAGPNRTAWGDATYVNYRRFQTSARIVPQ